MNHIPTFALTIECNKIAFTLCCVIAGKKGNNTKKIVIITISSIAVVSVVVALFGLWYQKSYGKNKRQGGKYPPPSLFNQIGLLIVKLALIFCYVIFLLCTRKPKNSISKFGRLTFHRLNEHKYA